MLGLYTSRETQAIGRLSKYRVKKTFHRAFYVLSFIPASRVDRRLPVMKQTASICSGLSDQLVAPIHMLSSKLPMTTLDKDQPQEDRGYLLDVRALYFDYEPSEICLVLPTVRTQ